MTDKQKLLNEYIDWCDQLKAENESLKKELQSKRNYLTAMGKHKYELIERIEELKLENEELKETIKLQNQMQEEVCEEKNQEIDQLTAELKKYQDMAKEGLDNYQDVGGCWGCGISLSFDELLESYKRLEKSYYEATKESPTATRINAKFNKYEKALQNIYKIIVDFANTETKIDLNLSSQENIEIIKEQFRQFILKILQNCEVVNE